jgi:PAS domain S-box-containing protein
MLEPPLPPDEERRLQVLLDLNLLDTAPEERFDRITRMAARLFDVPVALVGLLDAKRNWFKSRVGVAEREEARQVTLCAHAILQDGTMVVEDTLDDERYVDNPFVASGQVRFYAGVPLAAPDGSKVGTLCLIDRVPRRFDDEQRALLRDLAAMVANEFAADELRRALARQRDAERWQRALLEHLPEGVLMLDETAEVLAANPAAGALFGVEPGAMAGRSVQHLIVDALGDLFDGQPGGGVRTREVSGRRSDGKTFPLELAVCAMLYGGRRRFAAIVRDLRPRLEQAWRQRAAGARRHKTFTHASHELRTPLASIVGFAELLLKRDFDPATARELLEIIHTQAGLMSTVVNQVFDLARIESGGRQALQIATVPLGGVLTQVLETLAPLGQNARIALALAPGLPPVAADADRLALAFANVIGNSIKYAAPATTVHVHAWAEPDGDAPAVLVEVRDQGAGMTPEQLERLFEPFYRVPAAPGEGTGLGMAIVQEIVNVHNGSIQVQSQPGLGTTVTIRLPVGGEAPDA